MIELKSTGLTRKMDDMGRVVIPKSLRAQLNIQEGEELEVLTLNEKAIVLQPVRESNELDGLFYWMDGCSEDMLPLTTAIRKLVQHFQETRK
jgi:AbrB family looped-hinge helix DNA binding protein